MKLPLAYYGHPLLRKKCERIDAITDEVRALVADMEETMFAHDGIGLAAPQVRRDLSLFIVNIPEETEKEEPPKPGITRVFINPKVLSYSQEQGWRSEGCLSIPTLYAPVERPLKITVEATDLTGNVFTEEFSGLYARAILHENDHINGVLFIDRIHGKKRQEIDSQLRQIKKKYSSLNQA